MDRASLCRKWRGKNPTILGLGIASLGYLLPFPNWFYLAISSVCFEVRSTPVVIFALSFLRYVNRKWIEKVLGRKKTYPQRQRKRKFQGNRYTSDTLFTSTSAAKIMKSGDDEIPVSKEHGYCFNNFFTVFSIISNYVICKECHDDIKFQTSIFRSLGFKIILECKCGKIINSSPLIDRTILNKSSQ